MLDADDLWRSNHLERIHEYIENNNVDLISNDEIIYHENKKVSYLINKPPNNLKSCLLEGNTLSPSAMTIKKEVFDSVGFFIEDKAFLGLEDWDFWLRSFYFSKVYTHLNEPLGIYRRDGYNMSKEDSFHEKTFSINRLHSDHLIKKGELLKFDSLIGENFLIFRRNLKNFILKKDYRYLLRNLTLRNLKFFLSKLMFTLIIKFIYGQISTKIKNLKMRKELKCIVKELL